MADRDTHLSELTSDEYGNQLVRNAEQLLETISTPGWSSIIHPMLNRMITDAMGGFDIEKGKYINPGLPFDTFDSPDACLKSFWYRQGLIDFVTRTFQIIDEAESYKKQSVAPKRKEGFTVPLFDTKYSPEKVKEST